MVTLLKIYIHIKNGEFEIYFRLCDQVQASQICFLVELGGNTKANHPSDWFCERTLSIQVLCSIVSGSQRIYYFSVKIHEHMEL